ncbi:MAG: gliding motility-associated C-terminal domain-containing protein [Cyclobacteriaceae bacterium]|nr:gliding motility-associated C-terminal domain-containing protein [Cyclobacteriaceae bacterium]
MAWGVAAWLCLSYHAQAQTLSAHNWYFGNSVQGIRFDRGNNAPALVTNQQTPFGTAGAVVVTDITNGNPLFYSDGNVVYDATRQVMLNTAGLGGFTGGNQPVAVTPIPGQPNKYFVFANSANFTTGGTVRRLVIDMALPGNSIFPAPPAGAGEGAVAAIGLTNRSEGMITVPHANGTDFWLITHQNGTSTFSATRIEATSYTPLPGTFTTNDITLAGLPATSVAHFAYHAATGRLAVAPQDPNTNAVILDFDNNAGTFSLNQVVFNSGFPSVGNQAFYDIEWDFAGQYLYLSRHGDGTTPANVFQFDTQDPTISLAPLFSTPPFRSYGLQYGPDSAMYHLYQAVNGGPFLVGRFTDTDTVASEVDYEALPFGSINFNGTQFPSFVPFSTPTLNVAFTFAGTCERNPVSFFPTVTPAADSLRWDFGDGETSGNWSPIHTYGAAGTFNVSLTAFFQGQPTTISQPVTINPFPLQLQLVPDTTACRSEFPPSPTPFSVPLRIQGGSVPDADIVWSNGDIGPNLTPDGPGFYYVTVTTPTCVGYASVNVREYGLQDQRFNIWYFGDRAGIDFNVQPPVGLPAGTRTLNAPEGVAIVCDRNGDVIFYTDGDRVFDEDDIEVDNGIGGDPLSTQSALIVPVPGDETLYYIFTTQAVNGASGYRLSYSLFDLKRNAGKGDIVQKNITLFTRSTERVTSNGQWLIAHEFGNDVFRAYPITANGIGDPVFTSIGSIHGFTPERQGEGYLKMGGRSQVAVALSNSPTNNVLELFTLVDSTGRLTNFRALDLSPSNGQVYGVEFSGNRLFATIKGPPSEMVEYYIDSLDQVSFRQRVQNPGELGAIETGPDGQVYFAINNNNALGTIQVNGGDEPTDLSVFNFTGFPLAAGTQSRLGLPNFVQSTGNAAGGPDLIIAGFCFGQPTQFDVVPTDPIDTWTLAFGDGNSVQDSVRATYTYVNPTPAISPVVFIVNLSMTNRCGLDTLLTRPIEMFNPPASPSIPAAAALCTVNITLDANQPGTPNLTHQWTTGETTRTLFISQQGTYGVTNTDTNTGCSSTALSILVDNRPQVELGPDLTLCENTPTPALDAGNAGLTIVWSGAVTSSGNSIQIVDTSAPGVFTYNVQVTDAVTTCTTSDTKTYTINPSPSISLGPVVNPNCGASTGSFSFTENGVSTGPFSFTVSGPVAVPPGVDRPNAFTVNTGAILSAGTYAIVVTDQLSQCATLQTVGVSNPNFTLAATQTNTCAPVNVDLTVTGGAAPFNYRITGSQTNGTPVNLTFNNQPANRTIQLPAGSYTAEATAAGCVSTTPLVVTVDPPVPFNFDLNNFCSSPTTRTIGVVPVAGATYAWSGPNIQGATTNPSIQIGSTPAGTFTYNVTVTPGSAGQCPNTQSVNVTIPVPVVPDFTVPDGCADVITLTATPAGSNLTYRWYRNGSATPLPNSGRSISLGVNDDGDYQVEIVSSALGACPVRSAVKPVTIVGPITATILPTAPCDNNQPFRLEVSSNVTTGVTYEWRFNNQVIDNAAVTNQTSNGTYTAIVTSNRCSAQDDITITKAPVPLGDLPERALICADAENPDPETSRIDLDPGAFQSYAWFKDQVSLGITTRVLTADAPGLFEVDITNTFGCVSRDRTEVENDCVPRIVAPTAFRPSSQQAANRAFNVFSFFITDDFQILIYNRWGELVFESKDRFFQWNGTYNNTGAVLPSGTYAYVVRYVSRFRPENGVQEQRGGVVLLR